MNPESYFPKSPYILSMKYLFPLTALLCLLACQTPEPPPLTDQWLGTHDGTALRWTETFGVDFEFVRTESSQAVTVEIRPGTAPGSVDMELQYEDGPTRTHTDLLLPEDERYTENWGAGSQAGSLSIELHADSLSYARRQKCGIPCTSGVEWVLWR